MTPQEKVEELIENLGVFNAIYLAEHVLIVLEDYELIVKINDEIQEWKEVLALLEKRQEKL
jgi:hypothetical protein